MRNKRSRVIVIFMGISKPKRELMTLWVNSVIEQFGYKE